MILNSRGRAVTSEPVRQRSVKDLLRDCQDAAAKMSRTNSHRALLWECVQAITDLSLRLYRAEQYTATASPIFAPNTEDSHDA